MDACEIANFLATELFMQQLASFDGFNSGIGAPTRTTATLTPTTLKNIEQTFIDLQNEPTTLPYQAGFVPPLAPSYSSFEQDQSLDSESMSSSSWHTTTPPMPADDLLEKAGKTVNNNSSKPRRNMGGRRPTKASNLTPEEEEKRRVRRERNKLAAARCRRRREDHTNELMGETEQLEKKKQALQNEVHKLQQEKEELEFILESHRAHCRRQIRPDSPLDVKPAVSGLLSLADKIKSEPTDSFDSDGPPSPKRIMLSSAACVGQIQTPTTAAPLPPMSTARANRPSSLNVPLSITPSQAIALKNGAELTAIPIQTPSNGIFNFDSLMDGGTGLTPVGVGVNNPLQKSNTNTDLITPTDPSKLVSL